MRLFIAWGVGCVLLFATVAAAADTVAKTTADGNADEVDFTRDVRPILSQHCFKCHGPDSATREAGLRLDQRDAATKELESGERAIVPGKAEASELVRRIFVDDENEMMPPPAAKKPLSDKEKQILKRWIAAGAEYREHWAFVAPRQVPLPAVKQTAWPRNTIDYFVLTKLERAGLAPSAEADRYTLARRVSLDLIGLPPTPEALAQFIADGSPQAYENYVDRLLASPHYGERWTRRWLDLARYADTNGYEKDRQRSIWPYRDWVIAALNADKPFDQFTIEQLAGDMLPGATAEQRIATGFHRNTMLNEEGGADPLEFRYHAVVDRVNTTGTTWLGLTLQCCQCHTHKYDPLPQQEYYQFMALLNNADEPEMDVPRADIASRRAEFEQQIAALTADLPNRFPADEEMTWIAPSGITAKATSGATITTLDDGSLLVSGTNAEIDTYTIELTTQAADLAGLRLETLTHESLGRTGPGRTAHGNFVLTEVSLSATPLNGKTPVVESVAIASASSDVAQGGFPVAHAFDGDAKTGWAVDAGGKLNSPHTATFQFAKPTGQAEGTRWKVQLQQNYGGKHTIGRFRVLFGQRRTPAEAAASRGRQRFDERLRQWVASEAPRAVRWTVLKPTAAKSSLPSLTILDDGSVLASGDLSKRDTYEVDLPCEARNITGIRLEMLPDDSLPGGGPGRAYYEGTPGDFFLSKFEVFAARDGKPLSSGDAVLEPYDPLAVRLRDAMQTFAQGGDTAAGALDGDDRTGWSIAGGVGKLQTAAFRLADPLSPQGAMRIRFTCARYFASGVGRFRISITSSPIRDGYVPLPADVEAALASAANVSAESATRESSVEMSSALVNHFATIAPELEGERQRIAKLRAEMPKFPRTLVMRERPATFTRPTYRHHRGEYTQPKERVAPDVFAMFPRLPPDAPRDRLSLARWLADPRHPLVGRVTVNRQWAAFFGRGIVRTTEDFGYQGATPSHGELLDWLAVEFIRQGWSMKQLHRMIVTSATYRQTSQATADRLSRDPVNELLSRGPRQRIEAELVRDVVLSASGLFSEKIGGPSVFPPQPPGVSTEGAYGPLAWNVSTGGDRYRRGLYTFSKRTAPYAMFATFDGPSGEACVARREVSNTPLQALTLLNDGVVMEAAQEFGRTMVERRGLVDTWAAGKDLRGTPDEVAVAYLVERCLSRPATEAERNDLTTFLAEQRRRCTRKELNAASIAGGGTGDVNERAAWTLVARVLLNVDEFVTKR